MDDITTLKDAVKSRLSTIMDEGLSLKEAVFETDLTIEKKLRIDLAYKQAEELKPDTMQQVRFRCVVQLELVSPKQVPVTEIAPSDALSKHKKNLSSTVDSRLAAPETFLTNKPAPIV